MSDETRSSTPAGPTSSIDVSVVIPVFNALPYLTELMESLVDQDLADEAYEIIAVNDGSTDGSGLLLDGFAARHANLRVVHQANSGWPGGPRNVGLDLARGRYVFFADADDLLGVEALRRMIEFADQHDSDIVVPKVLGLGGRLPGWEFEENEVDANMELVLKRLHPQKLFRRSMLLDAGIRFPEEKVRLEDGMMIAQAYFRARRVSALSDYDYYFLRRRDDGKNISRSRLDPEGYTWSVGEVSRLIRENDPDPARAGRIILDLYRRKCLKIYAPDRFVSRMGNTKRDLWMQEHQKFMAEFIPPELESTLAPSVRRRSQLLRAGDKDSLLTLARLGQGQALSTLVRARCYPWAVRLSLRVEVMDDEGEPPGLRLLLQDRHDGIHAELPISDLRPVNEEESSSPTAWADLTTTWECSVVVPQSMLKRSSKTVIDVSVVRELESGTVRSRVSTTDATDLRAFRSKFEVFETIKGHVSIRVRP